MRSSFPSRFLSLGAMLLLLLLSSCQSRPADAQVAPSPTATPAVGTSRPPQPAKAWSMRRVYETGGKGGGYRSEVRVSSDGRIVDRGNSRGSTLNFKPETYRQESKATPEQLASLSEALQQAMLTPPSAAQEFGTWQLTVTMDGRERTFFSRDQNFSGPAAPLAEALEKVSPWRPRISRPAQQASPGAK